MMRLKYKSQDNGKEEKANMSILRANRGAVIERPLWPCLSDSQHYDNTAMPTSHSSGVLLI